MSMAEEACLGIAVNAAVAIIRLHREAVTVPESVFSYATDVSRAADIVRGVTNVPR